MNEAGRMMDGRRAEISLSRFILQNSDIIIHPSNSCDCELFGLERPVMRTCQR